VSNAYKVLFRNKTWETLGVSWRKKNCTESSSEMKQNTFLTSCIFKELASRRYVALRYIGQLPQNGLRYYWMPYRILKARQKQIASFAK